MDGDLRNLFCAKRSRRAALVDVYLAHWKFEQVGDNDQVVDQVFVGVVGPDLGGRETQHVQIQQGLGLRGFIRGHVRGIETLAALAVAGIGKRDKQ